MSDETTASDGHALAERYEAMRRDVLDDRRHSVRGLALLMCGGMAAWMKCVAEIPAPIAPRAALSSERRIPLGIEQGVVDIVAAMALATAPEVLRESRDKLGSPAKSVGDRA
jgi:hypothetical protein